MSAPRRTCDTTSPTERASVRRWSLVVRRFAAFGSDAALSEVDRESVDSERDSLPAGASPNAARATSFACAASSSLLRSSWEYSDAAARCAVPGFPNMMAACDEIRGWLGTR